MAKKENITPNIATSASYEKLQNDLKKTQIRKNHLAKELIKAKTDIQTMHPEKLLSETIKEIPSKNNPENQLTLERNTEIAVKPHHICKLEDETLCKNESKSITSCTSSTKYKSKSYVEIGDLVLSSRQLESINVNTIYELNENNILLGSENGLYFFNRQLGTVVQIKGINGISVFGIQRNCSKAILVSNHDNKLHQCDLRQLENCSHATYLEHHVEFISLDYSLMKNDKRWHYCKVNFDGTNITAIAAQASQILILKFDTSNNIFKPVRTMDTAEPVISVHFTKHSVIVASNKFFEIDLMTYAAEEFLDMSDISLRDTVNLKPLFITQINCQEFLLCFKETGIFVDEFGNRSRPIIEDLEWLYEPINFLYKETFLFVSHADCLQVIKIEKSFTRELIEQNVKAESINKKNNKSRAFLNLQDHKLVCSDSLQQGIYVLTRKIDEKQNINHDIYFFEGIKVLKTGVKNNNLTMNS